MKSRLFLAAFVVVPLLLSPPVQAAVVTVDVTIKVVNPQARGITVVYKTELGEKTIELDVSRKAEITVNGKEATLDSLGAGLKGKVSFDRDLASVTKIEATGTVSVGREVHRMTLQISEVAAAILRIEKTAALPEDDFKGTPFTFSRWPKTKATKGQDGMFRLVHDFRDADDPKSLAMMEPVGVSLDRELGVLTFTPPRLPEGKQAQRRAGLGYGKKQRLPLRIYCDIASFGGGFFQTKVMASLGLLSCSIRSDKQGLHAPVDVRVGWVESGDGGKENVTELFNEQSIALDKPFEKRFRLPLPNAKISEPFLIEFTAGAGKAPTTLARLEIQGRVSPMFGLALAEKESLVYAKKVIPDGLAEKAGFQAGDVLREINGVRPQSLKDAMMMLARLPVGEKVVFTIGRGNETQKLTVVAE